MAEFRLGTCAWSFDDWAGPFYPEHLPVARRLDYYAAHFNAVEVDSTFYAVPSAKVIARWCEMTPADFVFCPKVPRAVTHEMGTRPVGADFDRFVEAMRGFGNKLGCVLAQFAPGFRAASHWNEFMHWTERLPSDVRFGVEFRDESWDGQRIDERLRERGIVRVWSDMGPVGEPGAFLHRERTGPDVYVRLMGDLSTKYEGETGETAFAYRHVMWDRGNELDDWVLRLRSVAEAGVGTIYVMGNNHYEGFAPATMERMRERLGLPKRAPDYWQAIRDEPDDMQFELNL